MGRVEMPASLSQVQATQRPSFSWGQGGAAFPRSWSHPCFDSSPSPSCFPVSSQVFPGSTSVGRHLHTGPHVQGCSVWADARLPPTCQGTVCVCGQQPAGPASRWRYNRAVSPSWRSVCIYTGFSLWNMGVWQQARDQDHGRTMT